uniref:Mitochondrial ribosomal protein S9 n=2 Tax=Molossus molossus TaxID=27622 RepID=A0A7J8E3H3_MOLMO|nr:mitochondrial ribosomal protein S9 [Molossus molossus]
MNDPTPLQTAVNAGQGVEPDTPPGSRTLSATLGCRTRPLFQTRGASSRAPRNPAHRRLRSPQAPPPAPQPGLPTAKMAASCVSCGAAVSHRLFLGGRVSLARRRVLWNAAAAELQTISGPQILRRRHTAVVTTKKNVAALRRETYTVDFIKKQIEEFNIGKRHLANMMGEDPETFTQEDIDRAIAYLFPSGLFEKRARPIMKHPEQIFPKQKATQWGEDGRPFHFLFYTGKQSYYSLMHDAYGKLLDVQKQKNQLQAEGLFSEKAKTKDLIGSRWLIKEELEEMLVEKLSDQDYAQFVRLLERLLTLQCGAAEEEFVQRFRRSVTVQSKKQLIEPLQYDEKGMAFSTSEGKRKSAKAEAVVYEHGSGRIEVNGTDYLLYFPVTQDRETDEDILLPLGEARDP